MTARVRASWILGSIAMLLYGHRLALTPQPHLAGWGLPMIHDDCGMHMGDCVWNSLLHDRGYYSPLPQIGLDIFSGLLPSHFLPPFLQAIAILLLICNTTLLMSILHRITHRLDLAASLAGVFLLVPLQWSQTQLLQFSSGAAALFFAFAAVLYVLAAQQHRSGRRTRLCMATFCFVLGIGFHPLVLAVVLVPLLSWFWQEAWRPNWWFIGTASVWVLIGGVWYLISTKSHVAPWPETLTWSPSIAMGSAVVVLGVTAVCVAKRDALLASMVILLLSAAAIIAWVIPDPLLALGGLPPAYVLLLVAVSLCAVGRLLSYASSPWLRQAIPAVAIGVMLAWQVAVLRQDPGLAALPEPLLALLSADSEEDWRTLADDYPGIWQIQWQLAEHTSDHSRRETALDRARQLAPQQPWPFQLKIEWLLLDREHAHAGALAASAVTMFDDDARWQATFRAYLGIANARQGLWQSALVELNGAMPWLASNEVVLRELTRTYQKIGDRKNAMRTAIRLRRLSMLSN